MCNSTLHHNPNSWNRYVVLFVPFQLLVIFSFQHIYHPMAMCEWYLYLSLCLLFIPCFFSFFLSIFLSLTIVQVSLLIQSRATSSPNDIRHSPFIQTMLFALWIEHRHQHQVRHVFTCISPSGRKNIHIAISFAYESIQIFSVGHRMAPITFTYNPIILYTLYFIFSYISINVRFMHRWWRFGYRE